MLFAFPSWSVGFDEKHRDYHSLSHSGLCLREKTPSETEECVAKQLRACIVRRVNYGWQQVERLFHGPPTGAYNCSKEVVEPER